MAKQKFSNNASSKLAGALTNIATSLSVTASEGAKFPALAAGEWFNATLVKLVGGLPVYEIVRVTARTGDTMTIVRAQESTTATTFSAGEVIDVRPTAGGMDNMAQQGGDNSYTGTNDFTGGGSVTLPTVAGADNSNKAVYSGWVRGYAAAKGANNDITSLSGLTTALSVAQGGTGATTGPNACINLGAVQQGTGTGQGSNVVKLGWGTAGGGLKATVDTTDQGYFPFSTTNPNGGAVITFANPLTAQAANFTTITASGLLSANAGLSVAGAATALNGGAAATLGNNGYLQIGGSAGLNIVLDFTKIQARNNSAAAQLNLNTLGGLVQVGSGGLAVAANISGTTMNASGRIFAQNAGDDKLSLYSGVTAQGHIGADNTTCFKVANAAFSSYVLALDNSGNLVASGNITAFSDEDLKTNWQSLYAPGQRLQWLTKFSQVLHGQYERTDTGEVQIGAGARSMRKVLPKAVSKHKRKGQKAVLSLNYGAAALMGAMEAAAEVVALRKDLDKANKLIAKLASKLGGAG